MISVNEFSAWITVDDNILQEYDIKVSPETNTVVCWIASEAGKSYSLHWRNDRFRTSTAGYAYIDGLSCGGKVLEHANVPTTRMDGITTSPTTMKPFAFSTVNVTDDINFLSTPDTPEMGEIKITIKNVQVLGNIEFKPVSVPAPKTYHETAKKGLNHQTSFRDELKVAQINIVKAVPVGGPVATFLFKYRPLAMLQATGIAPRPTPQRASPSPQPPAPSARNNARAASSKKRSAPGGSDAEDVKPDISLSLSEGDDGGSDDDSRKLQELQNQMDAIRAKRKKIKTEKKPKVKAEKIEHLGTIDLTLDDD
ncbi:hypothetical protein VNI00_013623 [Paramarasmius palmivorus]|uniref:DUF7918 domain-containing protein n=1 Tax=Paramarasmius palmivorus TaxID=297713 RepID=A0AAW0BXI6_9AGAR